MQKEKTEILYGSIPLPDRTSPPLPIAEQILKQNHQDERRLAIGIDCPPGEPRPSDVFSSAIDGTGLTVADFIDPGPPSFGCAQYLVKANEESIKRYLEAREVVGKRLKKTYEQGIARGVFW